jgi:copper chaperone
MASEDKRTQRLQVEGMKCEGCKSSVEQALRGLAGVEDVKVYLNEGTASIVGEVEPEELIAALSKTNYQARPLHDE